MAEIPKKRWLLWLKFLKKDVAMAEIRAEGLGALHCCAYNAGVQ